LGYQILTEKVTKGDEIVNKKASGGKNQRDAARQHRYQR
jgi:hypothetical protein